MIGFLYCALFSLCVAFRRYHRSKSTNLDKQPPMMAPQDRRGKWALLIGINRYNSPHVPDLSGCLEDVDHMETYLRDSVGISNITKLKSPAVSDASTSPLDLLPTYNNVVGGLEKLAAAARKGDFVYIHFSGHGSRLPTGFQQLNCSIEDECLLLVRDDLHSNSGKVNSLRDVEFAYLLKKISDKGATITIVLDCCHSGGASRGISVPRGVDSLPENALVARSPLCKISVLEPFRTNQKTSSFRGASVVNHWLTSSRGVEFLAACRANQKAQEIQSGDCKRRGLLTECLLDVLQDHQSNLKSLTCDMIFNLVSKKVANHPGLTPPQDVVFGGERHRIFFGTSQSAPNKTTVISITDLPDECPQIKLSAGEAHGVALADEYAIYPQHRKFTSLMDYNSPSAICKISQVEHYTSTAVIKSGISGVSVDCKAVRQSDILKKRVLTPRSTKLLLRDGGGKELENLMRECKLIRFNDSKPFFTVTSSSSDCFKISFTPKEGPFESETTVNARSKATLISYLTHLSIYYNLLDLTIPSGYNGGLSVEKLGYLPSGCEPPDPCRYNPDDPPQIYGLESLDISDPQEIHEEDLIGLKVRNRSHKPMFIEILDLDPSWEATRVYPIDGNMPIEVLPGEATNFFLEMSMPALVADAVQPFKFDTIIVLATASERENFPVEILPTLSKTSVWHGMPLKGVENTRGAKGRDSVQWYAQRVDVRVV